jgi:hypothetical protein
MPKRTWCVESWRVEPRRPAPCLRDHGSDRSRRTAARRCRRQARHPLQSRGVVRLLPAPVPWALLRPPPFVRPIPPSDSCHTLVTETVPDYPSRGLRRSAQSAGRVWYDLRRCKGVFANRCWRSTTIVNRSRTVDSACIDAIVLPGDFSLGGGSCLIRGAKKIRSSMRRGAVLEAKQQGRRLSGARLLLLASRVLRKQMKAA